MTETRPVTMLIAALGGEGGGVLTQWIVAAAEACGYPVQSTSIPGVAQRTGATTYYIEMLPVRGGRRPVFALSPGGGDVDLVLASELLESGRTIASGYVTPDRTTLIASTSRSYIVTEKMAMADGRFDPSRLREAAEKNARKSLLLDLEAIAEQHGVMINAVMLGAVAGAKVLPISPDTFEAVIRAEQKAVEANLRGFRAGFDAIQRGAQAVAAPAMGETQTRAAEFATEVAAFPPAAQAIVREGVRRLTRYQDRDYARLYLERLSKLATTSPDGALLRDVGRNLALRMSFEDLIRVAEAKIDPERLARLEKQAGASVYSITEFLKPGIEEFCSVLPPRLARRILATAARRGWNAKHWAMELKTLSISGYLRLWCLAKLKPWRRGTFRYGEEQAQIEDWLGLVHDAARLSPMVAIEVAECAGLIKGYGDTLKRGLGTYQRIAVEVVRPLIAEGDARRAADAIASARAAALRDPDGEALAQCITHIHAPRLGAAAE